MANKDFERMIKLGEWLEEYLTPDIHNLKLFKLFQRGPKLIDVNEKISPTCEISLYLIKKLPKDKYSFEKIESIKKKAEVFINYRINLQKILQEVHKYNLPWQRILLEFENDDFLHGFTGQLRAAYSELRETIKKNDGEYCVAKSFSTIPYIDQMHRRSHKKALSEHNEKQPILDEESENATFQLARNYRTIVSRIFFDFLLCGGQEYFLFCKHCGKFTVIRRKGRKKFCSDICRTNYGREKTPANT